MCNSLFLEESEERRKCFLNVRLMFAKIRGIFEMNKVFNKNRHVSYLHLFFVVVDLVRSVVRLGALGGTCCED